MKVRMLVKQAFRLYLSVDLCGSDIRMAKHFLNRANVRSSHQQMSGKGMTQAMRAYVLLDTRLAGIILDQDPDLSLIHI